jgi:hypothetical protein
MLNDNGGSDNTAAPPPPDLAPPPAETPAPAPSIDYDRLAQANAQALSPMFQRFAPPPAPAPHEAENFFEIPQGLDGPSAAKWVRDRVQTMADARADAKVNAATQALEQKFAAALQGQAGYFQSMFAADPNFKAIQTHFDKYVRAGHNASDARYLAERDAGRHAAPSAPGATTTRTIGAPPPHLTTPAGRAGANAPVNGFDPVKFKSDENYRAQRFAMHKANAGYVQD